MTAPDDPLAVADPAQAELMAEECIVLDDDDNVIGSASKRTCHTGEGLLHRAFSVFLFNPTGELLLQRRADEKITFPGFWANTCCSHPLDVAGEREGVAGVKRAATRKLGQELGIPAAQVPPEAFHLLTRIHYRARYDAQWVEHEIDYVLAAKADVTVAPNHNEVAEVRWVDAAGLRALLEAGDRDEARVARWFRLIAEKLLPAWWGRLDDLPPDDGRIHRYGGD